MEQPEKELIQEIKGLFEDYEEAYVPGEWESFSAAKEKDYPSWGTWIKVAAVLFLIVSVLPYRLSDLYRVNDGKDLTTNAQRSKLIREKVALNHNNDFLKDNPDETKDNKRVAKRDQQSLDLITRKTFKSKKVRGKQEELFVAKSRMATVYVIASASLRPVQQLPADKWISLNDTAVVVKKEKLSTMDFLVAESKSSDKTKTKTIQPSKWDFGVEVAPNMTRSNMNIGGGLTTAYRLSDKFSLSSGVSLLQLETGMDIPASGRQAKMSVASLSSRELLAVNANIKAIDIPLAIVYHVNKHFYTSAGISYFNVLSEKRNNTYEQTSQVSQTTTNPETGFSSFDRVVVSESVSEPVIETRLKGNSYLGFFNFSIGRRQSLFKKYNVLIEPFIKVPVGKLSAEDLKLTNSGLKFQVSF